MSALDWVIDGTEQPITPLREIDNDQIYWRF